MKRQPHFAHWARETTLHVVSQRAHQFVDIVLDVCRLGVRRRFRCGIFLAPIATCAVATLLARSRALDPILGEAARGAAPPAA